MKDVLTKLGSNPAVKAAFSLEGEFYIDVIAEESSVIEGSMGMPLVNRALEEVRKRRTAVCVFCYGAFEVTTGHIMTMEDKSGNVIGHDVRGCMLDELRDDPNIIWLCDDFAIYPDKIETQEIFMVMLPQRVCSIGEKEGVRDPVILYPATTTDIMLKMHFGIPLNDPGVASAIIAFDDV